MEFGLQYFDEFFDIHTASSQQNYYIEENFIEGLIECLRYNDIALDIANHISFSVYSMMTHCYVRYHTPVLVLAMHQVADFFEIKREPFQNLTIWFQHSIYYPNFPDNAIASCRFMESVLAGTNINKYQLKEAIKCIKNSSNPFNKINPNYDLTIDLNLINFMMPINTFKIAMKLYEKEYKSALGELKYLKQRIIFFKSLLQLRRIYKTPRFKEFEEETRDKITLELQILKKRFANAKIQS